MTDYYAILGVTKTASDSEIKVAFRKLAKIYHPDKNPNNPNAKTIFEQVLKAYNVLINPHARKRFDYSQSPTNSSQRKHHSPSNKTQKEWTFTDEDLKKREYYKNYYKQVKKKANTAAPQPLYSDYKYILFATPLAVGLLMLVVSMFTSEPTVKLSKKTAIQTEDSIKKQESHN